MSDEELLNNALKSGDKSDALFVLFNMVKDCGFATIAKETGMSREGLYKTLDAQNGNPRLDKFMKIVNGIGFDFHIARKTGSNTAIEMRPKSLLSMVPTLSLLWHPVKNGGLSANDVTPSSRKKIWWRCSRDLHDWNEQVCSVINRSKKKWSQEGSFKGLTLNDMFVDICPHCE